MTLSAALDGVPPPRPAAVSPPPPLPPTSSSGGASHGGDAGTRGARRTFACPTPGCGRAFTRQSTLTTHVRRHSASPPARTLRHRSPTAAATSGADAPATRAASGFFPARIFACRLCGRRFGRRTSLTNHERSHANVRSFVNRQRRRDAAAMTAAASLMEDVPAAVREGGGGGDGPPVDGGAAAAASADVEWTAPPPLTTDGGAAGAVTLAWLAATHLFEPRGNDVTGLSCSGDGPPVAPDTPLAAVQSLDGPMPWAEPPEAHVPPHREASYPAAGGLPSPPWHATAAGSVRSPPLPLPTSPSAPFPSEALFFPPPPPPPAAAWVFPGGAGRAADPAGAAGTDAPSAPYLVPSLAAPAAGGGGGGGGGEHGAPAAGAVHNGGRKGANGQPRSMSAATQA